MKMHCSRKLQPELSNQIMLYADQKSWFSAGSTLATCPQPTQTTSLSKQSSMMKGRKHKIPVKQNKHTHQMIAVPPILFLWMNPAVL